MNGHAIECRINAEDFANGFMLCPGLITHYRSPGGPGVRVDSHLFSGYTVPPYYDSVLAKLVCRERTREETLVRMQGAFSEFVIDGVKTTAGFQKLLLQHEQFQKG